MTEPISKNLTFGEVNDTYEEFKSVSEIEQIASKTSKYSDPEIGPYPEPRIMR
jgi:hypothetical protein